MKHVHDELKKWAGEPAKLIMLLRPDVSGVSSDIQETISNEMYSVLDIFEYINIDQCWLLNNVRY